MRLGKSLLPVSLLSLTALTLGLAASGDARGRKIANPQKQQVMLESFGGQAQVGQFGMGSSGFAQFTLSQAPLGSMKAPTVAPHVGSRGGTVVVDSQGVITLDRDSGELIRTNREGVELARLHVQPGAGEIVQDGVSGHLYLADRQSHRVVRVDVSGGRLEGGPSTTLREPHGLALSPKGDTLYVTSVADSELVALDTQTLLPRWRVSLAGEPRGVAVSADGGHAMVSFLSTGAVANVDLGPDSASVSYIPLDPVRSSPSAVGLLGFGFGGGENFRGFNDEFGQLPPQGGAASASVPSLADTKDLGRSFARNAHAVGFVGNGIAIVPHQLSTPHIPSPGGEQMGTYGGGGGFTSPITHRVAMINAEDPFAPDTVFAQIGLHQPRAMAYDGSSDTLYLAGYGNDQLIAVAEVSQNTVHMAWATQLSLAGPCAPDGIAVDGDRLWVHCELQHNLVEVSSLDPIAATPQLKNGAPLAQSPHSPSAQRGAELFRRGFDTKVSAGGAMACASCHPEGRTDGLSWRIEGHNLQTPLLAGRLLGTHPFKWDGKDKDLSTSLSNTVGRLGGTGLSAAEVVDLQAFLESLPQPTPPTAEAGAIARGQALFESEEAACSACHDGPQYADGVQHDLQTNIGRVDTPSLIGLAHSAPYYHDGSAQTLRALLTDKASVHEMGQTAQLSRPQVDDLVAYLESL